MEVGGRLVVDAASFTVMPRDKVGHRRPQRCRQDVAVQGARRRLRARRRQGAPQGRLRLPPARSEDRRLARGSFGDPARALRARDRRRDRPYREAADRDGGDAGRAQRRPVHPGRGAVPARRRLLRRERSAVRWPPGSASARTGSSSRSACSPVANGVGSSSPASSSPASDVLCLDEPTNHLDVDAKIWLMGFLRQYRGALLVISHDLDLLDEAITRVLHLDRPTETATGHIVEYKGTYTQYSTARAEDERRLTKQAAEQEREIARMQKFVDRFGAKATKADAGPLDREAHRPPRGGEGRTRPKATQADHRPVPRPAAVRRDGDRGDQSCARATAGRRCSKTSAFDLGRGERLLVLGLNGAGKTSLLRILAGETRPTSATSTSATRSHAGYYAQEHDNLDRAPKSLLDNIRADMPPDVNLTETELRGLLGMFGLSGREGLPGRRHPVRRREDEARAGHADGRAQQPAAARRADQQPRPAVAAGGRRRARRAGRARSSSSATTPSS